MVRIWPPPFARNCAFDLSCIGWREMRSMSEPPATFVELTPPWPSTLTPLLTVRRQPASEIDCPAPLAEPPAARMFCATVRPATLARPAEKSMKPGSPLADSAAALIVPVSITAPPASPEASPPVSKPLTSIVALIVRFLPALASTLPPSPPSPLLLATMEPSRTMSPSRLVIRFGSPSPESNEMLPPEPSKLFAALARIEAPVPRNLIEPNALTSISPPSPAVVSVSLPFIFNVAGSFTVTLPPGTTPPRKSSPAMMLIWPPYPPPTRLSQSIVRLIVTWSPASKSASPPSLPPPVSVIAWLMTMSRAAWKSTMPPDAWFAPRRSIGAFTVMPPAKETMSSSPPSA